MRGADWRHPRGPGSTLQGLWKHPVVHVAYEDVEAYATWAGKALPTEAEWEFAARGGLDGAEFVWGDEFTPGGKSHVQHLAGRVSVAEPARATATSGPRRSASFPPNGYGLYDMAGNVWEWTTDWYQEHGKIAHACCTLDNPRGGEARRRATTRALPEPPHPAQGDEGRLLSVRAQLLPPLSAGGAHGAARRHRDLPPRFPLHRAGRERRVAAVRAAESPCKRC